MPKKKDQKPEERFSDFNKRIIAPSEMRAIEENDSRRLEGHAAVFNTETTIGGWFRELIEPGAFQKTLVERDQIALWNHNYDYPLGRKSEDTLSLWEDEKGLAFRLELGKTSWASDAYEAISRKDVKGMSFGFRVIREEAIHEDGKLTLYRVKEIALYEISPTPSPAYPTTEVDARNILLRCNRDMDQAGWKQNEEGLWVLRNTSEPEESHSSPGEGNDHDEPGEGHSDAVLGNLAYRNRQLRLHELNGRRFQKWMN